LTYPDLPGREGRVKTAAPTAGRRGAAQNGESTKMQQPSFLDILTHTPGWVWGALLLVLVIGVRRMQDRDVTVSRLVVFPLIVAGLALSGLASAGFGAATLEGFVLGMVAGGAAGVALERRNAAVRLADGRLRIKGELTSLLVILAIFASHYVASVIGAIDPATAASGGFQLVTALVSGFFCTMMLVRTGLRLRVAMA